MLSTVLKKDGNNLRLDNSVLQWIVDRKELLAVIEGDSLVLKKRRSLLDFAVSSPDGVLSSDEIDDEIHQSRKRK